MRIALGFLVVAVLWAGGASASSFVVLPAMEARVGPSMIELGSLATPSIVAMAPPADGEPNQALEVPPGETVRLSPSIIALGEPDVGLDKVAAIAPQSGTSRHEASPMVIRGGVAGDAFAPAAPSEPVTLDPGASVPGATVPGASPQAAADAPPLEGQPTPGEPAPAAAPVPVEPGPSATSPE